MVYKLAVATVVMYSGFMCNVMGCSGPTPFYRNASVLAPAGNSKILMYCCVHFVHTSQDCPIARDCKEWLDAGVNKSGIYPIKPDDKGIPFQVSKYLNFILSHISRFTVIWKLMVEDGLCY